MSTIANALRPSFSFTPNSMPLADLAKTILADSQIGKAGHNIDKIAAHLGAITQKDWSNGGQVFDAVMKRLSYTEQGELLRATSAFAEGSINMDPFGQTRKILGPIVDAAAQKIEDVKNAATDVVDTTINSVVELKEIIVNGKSSKRVTQDDLDLAKISAAVYDPSIRQVAGYTRLNAADLQKLGLNEKNFSYERSGFKAALYKKNDEYILAFAGTDGIKDGGDWESNFKTELGLLSPQHRNAVDFAKILANHNDIDKLRFTGHSLGGGLASLAGSVHGVNATTFNAAGVRDSLLERYSVDRNALNSNIRAISHRSDILRILQDKPAAIGADALGDRLSVGTIAAPGLKHGIDHVINSIEKNLAKQK
jgi:hypothetical protein